VSQEHGRRQVVMAAASDAWATTREVSGLWKGRDKKAMGEKIRRAGAVAGTGQDEPEPEPEASREGRRLGGVPAAASESDSEVILLSSCLFMAAFLFSPSGGWRR
jgi:hypothetical protein